MRGCKLKLQTGLNVPMIRLCIASWFYTEFTNASMPPQMMLA